MTATPTKQAPPIMKPRSRTPAARTLAYYRQAGYFCDTWEHWNYFAGIRRDGFGWIDLVVLDPISVRIIGVQATSGNNHAARRAKVLASLGAAWWVASGGVARVVSWSRRRDGRHVRWMIREEDVVPINLGALREEEPKEPKVRCVHTPTAANPLAQCDQGGECLCPCMECSRLRSRTGAGHPYAAPDPDPGSSGSALRRRTPPLYGSTVRLSKPSASASLRSVPPTRSTSMRTSVFLPDVDKLKSQCWCNRRGSGGGWSGGAGGSGGWRR
jgi:hypothetical protein